MSLETTLNFDNVSVEVPIRDHTTENIKSLIFKGFRPNQQKQNQQLLKNVSFSLESGQKLAVFGKNGAGKSTLLKTAAKIYPPSSGRVTRTKNYNAIFDLSTGFIPTISGRKNIYARLLFLGRNLEEISEVENEIINFSGLGLDIERPIYQYSSGMVIRLAFSISTAFKAKLMLVDEVFAVGDQDFSFAAKQRIEGLLGDTSLIFATHDLNTAKEICNDAIVLSNGMILFHGAIDEAIEIYTRRSVI